MSELWRRLRVLFRREQFHRDLDEEMQSHLAMQAEQNQENGMDPEEARHSARRQFGNATLLKERSGETWGWGPLERLGKDLHYALRMLRRNPGFTAVAVVTLALGIGVNASIFSLLNALLLRPLPVSQPERVVEFYRGQSRPCSYQDYLDLRDRNQVFLGLAADLPNESALDIGGSSQVILAEGVSGNYASVLGTAPSLGRWFTSDDERAAAGQFLAVISYRVWQTRFGGDPNVVGRQVRLESQWYTVSGVAGKDFQGTLLPIVTDLWTPLAMYAQHNAWVAGMVQDRSKTWIRLLGRLKPGITPAQAQADLNRIDGQLQREYPRPATSRIPLRIETARGVSNPNDRRSVAQLLTLLMAVAGLVLLIACANIANLLLARGLARRREISIRLAIGAGRARVVRQALIESLCLALIGAALGLALARWTSRLLETHISTAPFPIPVGADLSTDARVFGFALLVALLTTLLFGLVPAVQSSRPDLVSALKGAGESEPLRRRSFTLRNLYVVTQVALSLALLIVAGLFIRALRQANRIDPGFDPHGLLSARLYVAKPEFTEAAGRQLYHRAQEIARSLPGARSATFSYASPFLGSSDCVAPADEPSAPRATKAGSNIVGSAYFSTLGIPLIGGRDFTPGDSSNAPAVVIVNDVLAQRYWPNRSPIGKRLLIGAGCDKGQGARAQIVGVARDARYGALDKPPQPYVFFSIDQRFAAYVSLLIRAYGEPARLAGAIRKALLDLDPRLRIYEVEPLADQMGKSFWLVRWESWLLGAFGLLALLLAAVGLYGTIAFTTSRRTQEIGLRMALGAERRDVLRLVLGNGLVLALTGVALGLVVSLVFTRLLRGFLYGLSPTDSVTFLICALLWLAVALLASYIPARRAARVDPMEALRYE